MPTLLSEDASKMIADEIVAQAREIAKQMSSSVNQPTSQKTFQKEIKPMPSGYLNQSKAREYVGSRALLEKLEENGLSRFVVDGTVRYRISEIEEVMEIFRE